MMTMKVQSKQDCASAEGTRKLKASTIVQTNKDALVVNWSTMQLTNILMVRESYLHDTRLVDFTNAFFTQTYPKEAIYCELAAQVL